MHELLTLSQAADRLGIHVATLRAWVRDGRLPAYRLGQRFARVDWAEVLRCLNAANPASQPSSAVEVRGGI